MASQREMASLFAGAGKTGVAAGSGPGKKNYLDRFGVDQRTQEEIIQQMSGQRLRDALAQNDGRQGDFAGDLDIQDSGAAIGAMLANKFNKPQLNAEQKRGQEAKAIADEKMALMSSGGAFEREDGTEDVFKKADEGQRILAGELIKIGDPRGVDMARDLQARQREEQIYKEEREKAGLEIEGSKTGNKRDQQAFEQAQWDNNRKKFLARRGELLPVYVPGSNNPNSSIMAFVGDDGSASTMDNDGNIYQLPLGDYTTVRPDDPAAAGGGATADKFVPTPTEQKEMRAQQRALAQQARLAITMRDVLADAVNDDGTLNVLDGSGKGISFATKMVDGVNALFREGSKVVTLLGDDDKPIGKMDGTVSSSLKYVKDNKGLFDGFELPAEVRAKGDRAVARYQAAIVQMAYAKARANEPGARQLSDNDFKNALKQIGANATDPEALRQILFGDIERGLQDFDMWRKQIGEANAVRIISSEAMDDFDVQINSFRDAFEEDFGTPEQAGPGLTDPGGDRALGSPDPTHEPEIPTDETPEQRKARILGTG